MKSEEAASLRVGQQQVAEKTSLQGWAERSVWSLVCAMELGLIPNPSSDDSLQNPANKTEAQPLESIPLVPTTVNLPQPSKTPPQKVFASVRRRRRARRKTKRSATVRASNRTTAAKNSTVDTFWKSCKRKPEKPRRSSRNSNDASGTLDGFASEFSQANLREISPSSKRRRLRSQSFPVRTNDFQPADSPAPVAKNRLARPTPKVTRRSRRSSSTFVDVLPDISRPDPFFRDDRYGSENKENEPSTSGDDSLQISTESDHDSASKLTENRRSSDFVTPREISAFAGPSDTSASGSTREVSSSGSSSSGEPEKKDPTPRKDRSSSKLASSSKIRAKILGKDEIYHDVRRVTRGSTKIGKHFFVGKLVWGSCSGWWPALIIDAGHVGMLPEAGKLWVYWIGEARISLLNEKSQIETFSSNLNSRLTQNLNVARVRAIDAAMQMLRKTLGCPLTKPYSTWIENNFADIIETLDEIKFYPYPPKVQQRLDHLKEKNAKVTEKYLLDQKKENQGKKAMEKPKESPQRNDVDLTRLPLREQNPGVIAWAKIAGHNWWPAMIIDYRDCCMREPSFGCQWIMWYGDYKLSQVHHQLFLRFDKGIEKMRDYVSSTKKDVYLVGVLQAAKDYCFRIGVSTENWCLNDAFEYFSKNCDSQAVYDPPKRRESDKIYDKYSAHMVEKLNELKNDPNVDDTRADDINQSDDLRSAMSGKLDFESLCLKCLKVSSSDQTEVHPFFQGSLCKDCSEYYKPRMFVFGNDAKCFYCTVCAGSGTVIICDKEDCPRVYCTACVKYLLCPTSYERVLEQDPWECFLCRSKFRSRPDIRVKPRAHWKEKIIDMFRTNCNSSVPQIKHNQERRKIRVLSLFDGLSTGLLVLLKLGLVVDIYYASEIDPDALMVSASHFGDRIIHLGNVKGITKEKIKEIAPIDLLIGGSPCNDLSLANPARLGLYDPKGTGILFFEYCRILELLKKVNNGRHLFWLYENVASMPTEYRLAINKHLGQEPDVIDSADFSPQHRLRLYWHNLPIEPHSLVSHEEQDVQDILTPHCQRYALVKKIRTVTTKVNSLKQGKLALKPILMKDESDSLWITELEEIFGFPRHYTDVKNLSATKRQRLIGKSWSVQTLSAILRSLCPFYQCNTNIGTTSA